MKRRFLRALVALGLVGAAALCGPVRAALVTDTYQFDNLASDGSTVSGTFTYDTSNPSVVTDLTMTFSTTGDSFDSSTSYDPATLPTFDGSELVGSFYMDYPFAIVLVEDSGSFGPGATGSADDGTYLFGIEDIGDITVSGPITYNLTGGGNNGGSGSSVPLPTGVMSGLLGSLMMGGVAMKLRKRAAIA